MMRCELLGGPADGAGVFLLPDVEVLFAYLLPNRSWSFERWPAPGRYVYIRKDEDRERFTFEGIFHDAVRP